MTLAENSRAFPPTADVTGANSCTKKAIPMKFNQRITIPTRFNQIITKNNKESRSPGQSSFNSASTNFVYENNLSNKIHPIYSLLDMYNKNVIQRKIQAGCKQSMPLFLLLTPEKIAEECSEISLTSLPLADLNLLTSEQQHSS